MAEEEEKKKEKSDKPKKEKKEKSDKKKSKGEKSPSKSPKPKSKPLAGEDLVKSPKKSKSKPSSAENLSKSPKSKNTQKFSLEYFEAILTEVKEKCEKKIKLDSKDKDVFVQACDSAYQNWQNKMENEKHLDELTDNKQATKEELDEAHRFAEEASKAQPKYEKYAMKMALQIFQNLDGDKMTDIEDKLVKGAIIAQATPKALADFAAMGPENKWIINRLFHDPHLMKEMLRHGGASSYNYGNAMKIYVKCMGDVMGEEDKVKEESQLDKVNKKIALACALELASVQREFDSSVEIDPVARYKHLEAAHREGELDPAFPHFSVWEMRQIVNCDAPNDQMKWCRDTVMNYCPHITCITTPKMAYTYILDSDVRIRPPKWSGSPRTYQMVLAGGGNVSVNSWFGRFILKSFGLPAWGSVYRKKEGFTRWTCEGWEAMNGADWETATWKGRAGKDFKIETEARNKAPPEEYFQKLVYLQCLADVVDGDPATIPEEEQDVLHPARFWRSMSILSMNLLFATEPEVKRTFERSGESPVVSNVTKYLTAYETDKPDKEIKVDADAGKVTIPASRHNGVAEGNVLVIAGSRGGQQLNFFADGRVEYELPDDAPAKTYTMVLEVCTVTDRQTPLVLLKDDETENGINIVIPYTVGTWQKTEGVQVEAGPGSVLTITRAKNSLGLAIKKIILS